jgi:hypothetical protein
VDEPGRVYIVDVLGNASVKDVKLYLAAILVIDDEKRIGILQRNMVLNETEVLARLNEKQFQFRVNLPIVGE